MSVYKQYSDSNIVRVITPENSNHVFNELNDVKNSIFLAGPCPREDYEDDWRNEAIDILSKMRFDGVVLNPTNKYYDMEDPDHLLKQTRWEEEAMKKASAIVFWIERSEEHPAYTTNIEFGMWLGQPGIFVGWSDKAIKNNYIEIKLSDYELPRYKTLKSILEAVVKDLNRPKERWFLSDTHFSQQRTLELSRRPFRNLRDMDLTMISNWNKHIRKNDDVYFLGDFGADFEYLKLLNFKNLFFVTGNYERKDRNGNDISKETTEKILSYSTDKNLIYVFDRGECKITLKDGKNVTLIHEPINPNKDESSIVDNNQLYLYGHIHGRTLYKTNGTDCGVDVHGFAPISEEEIIWRLNAIKYLDENVWETICR